MQREPWIHFWGVTVSSVRNEILDALGKCGTKPQPLDVNSLTGEGILVFSAVDEALYDLVRELSHNREERILAVPITENSVAISDTWRLLHAGASDVLLSGSSAQIASQVKARLDRWRAVDAIMHSEVVGASLVGTSRPWRALLRQIVEVAHFTEAAVLLVGETGTGKELIGRLIRELDPRACDSDLAVVDCTTVVPELSGSEFFGHERGAFTGAVGSRDGAFAAADGGILFLDELGELPMPLQAQLLRVMQEGTYKRVGSDIWRRSRFRLVSATHRNLLEAVESGRFRQDLYYRIAGWVFRILPLKERCEDIIPLAKHFLRSFRAELAAVEFDAPVTEYLLNRSYPGNVRDLRQLMARISSRHVGPGPITVGDLPEDEWPVSEPATETWHGSEFEGAISHAVSLGVGLREISQAAADAATRITLRKENGNLHAAAQALHVTDRALQMRRAAWRSSIQRL